MTNHVPSPQTPDSPGLGWLLQDFVQRVAGADGALLASRDGLQLAAAGLTNDQADALAAVMSGLYSLAKSGTDRIKGTSDGGVRQVVIEHNLACLFVMSADDVLAPGAPVPAGTDARMVGCVLGVLAAPDCDPGVIGYQMAALLSSLPEHLVTARRGDAHPGGGR
ncbi:roadblock/LC7 domain-containing protein [Thermomonospora cellulosilytica]|uniref:Putative regulator of Ras-like GTPase activity (Roadblock/LC7/MglB family) n=1 Tax=Thermomonospora cellulosilytica TaxID=1411118 RepID=A0A7W3MVU0_9ACTN|nr:roadblock/LC7 domain-containing protein [Thermomonospora cellulosilytica]MBA9002826.1 putative regulator of Ras-like GTPase activity (Roadblock/LC7/MglB family) [Thermomonospora cellulosilytica]